MRFKLVALTMLVALGTAGVHPLLSASAVSAASAAPCPVNAPPGDEFRQDAYDTAYWLVDQGQIRSCATSLNVGVVRAIAFNPRTPADVLEALAFHRSVLVRIDVAARQDPPEHLLRLLSRDPVPAVRGAVAGNPSVPADVLNNLLNDGDATVRDAAGSNIAFLLDDADLDAILGEYSPAAPAPAPAAGATAPSPALAASSPRPIAAPDALQPSLQALTEIRATYADGTPIGDWFRGIIRDTGVTFAVGPLPAGVGGAYVGRDNRITVNAAVVGESPQVLAAVLGHELTHARQVRVLGYGGTRDCVRMEVLAYEQEAAVWGALWGGYGPNRTAQERAENGLLALISTEGEPGLYRAVTATPGYQDQCSLWTP